MEGFERHRERGSFRGNALTPNGDKALGYARNQGMIQRSPTKVWVNCSHEHPTPAYLQARWHSNLCQQDLRRMNRDSADSRTFTSVAGQLGSETCGQTVERLTEAVERLAEEQHIIDRLYQPQMLQPDAVRGFSEMLAHALVATCVTCGNPPYNNGRRCVYYRPPYR